MSHKYLYLLISLCFAVEIVSGTSSVVISANASLVNVSPFPSPSSYPAVLTSILPPNTPSAILSVEASESASASVQSTSTPSLSTSVVILPSPSIYTTVSLTTESQSSPTSVSSPASASVQSTRTSVSVLPSPSISTTVSVTSESPSSLPSVWSPAGEVSPTATSGQGTASAAPTGHTSTSPDVGTKGKTIGELEIVGFVILAILVVLVTAFAIYYVKFRKRMYPDYWSEPMVEVEASSGPAAAAQPAGVEVGITHEAFVGDSESPTKVAAPEPEEKAPEPEVKVAEPEVKIVEPEVKDPGPEAKVVEQEVKTEGKENEETEDSAL